MYQTGNAVTSSPSISEDDNAYFGCDDGRIIVLDNNKNLLWYLKTGGAVKASPLITSSGLIYAGSTDGNVYIN